MAHLFYLIAGLINAKALMAHIVYLIVGLIHATLAKRVDIIAMGPTVRPNFEIVSGKSKSTLYLVKLW